MIIPNMNIVGKYFIIKDLKFSDFMKDKDGNINLYDTEVEAGEVCGIYEFPEAIICKIEYAYKEEEE